MESWSILEKEPTATKFINSYATNSSIQNVSENHDTHQRTETVDNDVKEQISANQDALISYISKVECKAAYSIHLYRSVHYS